MLHRFLARDIWHVLFERINLHRKCIALNSLVAASGARMISDIWHVLFERINLHRNCIALNSLVAASGASRLECILGIPRARPPRRVDAVAFVCQVDVLRVSFSILRDPAPMQAIHFPDSAASGASGAWHIFAYDPEADEFHGKPYYLVKLTPEDNRASERCHARFPFVCHIAAHSTYRSDVHWRFSSAWTYFVAGSHFHIVMSPVPWNFIQASAQQMLSKQV